MPPKEELYKLYIIQNKSRYELTIIFNVSVSTVKRWLKKYKIKKSPKNVCKNVQKTFLHKYGVINYSMTDEGKKKISIKASNKTDIEKQNIYNKYKKTCLERYGTENIQQLVEIKKKKENTAIKHYGGVGFASKEINNKIKNEVIRKYGVDNCSKSEEIKDKKIKSKRKNNTFSFSKGEEYIYNKLLKKFNVVKRQYKSELYPFACDFYIPSIDLYIEYQGTWTHGKYNEKIIFGPYNPKNNKHRLILKKWQSKADAGSENYKDAIKVWTIRDPLKRKIAKENNLNWLEFFSIDDFNIWFQSINKQAINIKTIN